MPAVADALWPPDAALDAALRVILFTRALEGLELPLGGLLNTNAASPAPIIVVWLPLRTTPSH